MADCIASGPNWAVYRGPSGLQLHVEDEIFSSYHVIVPEGSDLRASLDNLKDGARGNVAMQIAFCALKAYVEEWLIDG